MSCSSKKDTNIISSCLIKAASPPPQTTHHLTPFNLCFLSPHYIQKGFLFSEIPPSSSILTVIEQLKSSLSVALHHFYPITGRLQTTTVPTGLYITIDCNNQGAQFIHALATYVKVEQVFALTHLTSLFPLNDAVNHDGHTEPLLAVQITELQNGLFLACCFNHAVGDGTSYWHFLNTWAEISRSGGGLEFQISRPPVHDKFFIEGKSSPVVLPYQDLDGLIERYSITFGVLRKSAFGWTICICIAGHFLSWIDLTKGREFWKNLCRLPLQVS